MNCPPIDQQVTFLYSSDLAKTAVFYQKILQMRLVLDQGSCQIFQTTPTAFLGFCARLGSHLEDDGRRHVILTLVSDQVDAWYKYLIGQEVEIEKAPTLNKTFNIYHLFIRDPNGYLIEIQQFLDETWPQSPRIN